MAVVRDLQAARKERKTGGTGHPLSKGGPAKCRLSSRPAMERLRKPIPKGHRPEQARQGGPIPSGAPRGNRQADSDPDQAVAAPSQERLSFSCHLNSPLLRFFGSSIASPQGR